MKQPICQSVPAFDATVAYNVEENPNSNIFRFTSSEGTRINANRLIIKENQTGKTVYDKTIYPYFKFDHIIPANTLRNGIEYIFAFQVFYRVNQQILEQSGLSDFVHFMCYKTPTLKITNIPESGEYSGSNFELDIQYNQEQKELLDISKVILFNNLGNKIFESGSIYNKSNKVPLNFKYTLMGLNRDTTYQVKVVGITVNKTLVESPRYIFTIRYSAPQLNTLLELKNNCYDGCIELKNNFIVIDSEQYPEDLGSNPKYLNKEKGTLDLREKDTFLTYKGGFNIESNFTERLFVQNPNLGNITTLTGYGSRIEVNLIQDKDYYLELKAYSGISTPYIIYSNPIKDKTRLLIWIRKKDNLFEVRGEKI